MTTRHDWLALTTLVGVMSVPASSLAAQVVYPTGTFPADVANVQAAADAGGTVILKAVNQSGEPTAFDFGQTGVLPPFDPIADEHRVLLEGAVEVVGETAASGEMTTIAGGAGPFLIVSGTVAVRGIHFDGPARNGVAIVGGDHVDVSDNVFTNLSGTTHPYGFVFAKGIHIETWYGGLGDVVIANNIVRDVEAPHATGIFVAFSDGDVSITDNEVTNAGTNGIVATINFGGSIDIVGNVVTPGPLDPANPFSVGNGILATASPDTDFTIWGNDVLCENPLADGILVHQSNAPAVMHNQVTMTASDYGGISLLSVSDAYVGQNRVAGDGAFGLAVVTWAPDWLPTSNTFVGNNLTQFDAGIADVLVTPLAQDTTLVGASGSVIDLGTATSITGFTPMAGGAAIGPQARPELPVSVGGLTPSFD